MTDELLTRRAALIRATIAGVTAAANPIAARSPTARAADPGLTDATLQAFADTILPGRTATATDLGNPIHPLAIAGVDPLPGAVEADALALYHHPEVGFDVLAPVFVAELEARALIHGATFFTSTSTDARKPQRPASTSRTPRA